MMTRQERKALGIAHKAALLDRLDRRMEVARNQGNQALLQQLEAEAKYINTKPIPLDLKALLSPVESPKNHSKKNQVGSWLSGIWVMLTMTKSGSN